MTQQIEVVYENGVLRPLGPVPAQLHESERYTVTITTPDSREARLDTVAIAAARQAGPAPGLEEVRRILAKIPGKLSDVVAAEREER
jgi:predicted DNA-binding antitoxin AbrB/MazE fold protein